MIPIWSAWCTRSYSSRCFIWQSAPVNAGRVRGQRVGYVALSVSREDERAQRCAVVVDGGRHPAGCGAVLAGIDKSRDQAVAEPLAALSTAMGRVARDDFLRNCRRPDAANFGDWLLTSTA